MLRYLLYQRVLCWYTNTSPAVLVQYLYQQSTRCGGTRLAVFFLGWSDTVRPQECPCQLGRTVRGGLLGTELPLYSYSY